MKKLTHYEKIRLFYIVLSLCCSIIAVCSIFLFEPFNKDGAYVGLQRMTAFTNISNVAVLIFTIWMLVRNIKHSDKYNEIYFYAKFIVSIMIGLTFIVFGVILTPGIYIFKVNFNPFDLRSMFNHWIVPIVFLSNIFFVNNNERQITIKESMFALIPPLVYYFLWMIIGSCLNPKRFQYPFMDYTKIGWLFEGKIHFGVIPFFFVILALLMGIIFLFRYLNNKLSTNSDQTSANN